MSMAVARALGRGGWLLLISVREGCVTTASPTLPWVRRYTSDSNLDVCTSASSSTKGGSATFPQLHDPLLGGGGAAHLLHAGIVDLAKDIAGIILEWLLHHVFHVPTTGLLVDLSDSPPIPTHSTAQRSSVHVHPVESCDSSRRSHPPPTGVTASAELPQFLHTLNRSVGPPCRSHLMHKHTPCTDTGRVCCCT